ncbi:MAG: hypothetical protein VX712_07500 [Bacteroidota bacterium]|nr:hypothetical protein [Christiangramia sp.]MEE2772047.1 hypothetical protein [Bacteroidota bacterium]
MKKLFTVLFCSAVLFSCSTDTETTTTNEENALTFEEQLASGALDNSSLGIYKGLFTTLDGQNRATILITLNGISTPTVEFLMPDGDKNIVRASENVGKGQVVDGLSFNEGDFKFNFNVNKDGSNPTITDITYMGKEGDAILLKETSKGAIETKTGTYTCESGCFGDEDDSTPHPELGAPGARQTFNIMLDNAAVGNSNITMQIILNRRTYEGHATQQNCTSDLQNVYNTCEIFAEPDLNGNSGPIRFRTLADPSTSLFFHQYSTTSVDCSTYFGTAVYRSSIFGRSTLSIITDDPVANGGDCQDLKRSL